MNANPPVSSRQALLVVQLIWLAIFISASGIAATAIVVFAKEPSSSQFFPSLTNPTQLLMGGLSLVTCALSFIVPTFILTQIAGVRTSPDAERTATSIYFVSRVVSFALAEASTLMGLTLTIFAHSDRIVIPGYILTVISLIANRPSGSHYRSILKHHGIGRAE